MLDKQKIGKETGMKKVSVIIPCYNVEKWIDRCILSIIVQTFGMDRIEIVCIDDASTDDTWAHLQKWERLYPEDILLIRQEVNKRQGAARNLGLSYSSAEWVTFVDADDWLEPDYLERSYQPTTRFDIDVVSCERGRDASVTFTYFGPDQRRGSGEEQYVMADKDETKKLLFIYDLFYDTAVWGKLIRKSVIIEHGLFFPENLVYEDMYWRPLLNIYRKGAYRIGERLYHYFLDPGSTSLAVNADHHTDWITIQMKKWKDYHNRGIWDIYREEMVFDCLLDAVGFLKLLILRYESPSFSLFQLEKSLIMQYVPDYKTNQYIPLLTETEQPDMLLKMLYAELDRKSFQDKAEIVKKMYERGV